MSTVSKTHNDQNVIDTTALLSEIFDEAIQAVQDIKATIAIIQEGKNT